jgi:hypothetical protein
MVYKGQCCLCTAQSSTGSDSMKSKSICHPLWSVYPMIALLCSPYMPEADRRAPDVPSARTLPLRNWAAKAGLGNEFRICESCHWQRVAAVLAQLCCRLRTARSTTAGRGTFPGGWPLPAARGRSYSMKAARSSLQWPVDRLPLPRQHADLDMLYSLALGGHILRAAEYIKEARAYGHTSHARFRD